jgi:hypothetical protein
MARARDADQFKAALLAQAVSPGGQELLHFIIRNMILMELLDGVGVHAGSIERAHIRLVNFTATRQQKERREQERPRREGTMASDLARDLHSFILVRFEGGWAALCPLN